MELLLPKNNLCTQEQNINFQKVSALIGENGAGKSSILQSIFNHRLESGVYHDKKIVCFSSGQNEKFSRYFSKYLASERQANRGLTLGCCYYDKSWSNLLIFLASMSCNGRVRGFLTSKEYIEQSDEELDDISSKLVTYIKIDQPYINRINDALRDEEQGIEDTFRTSAYHRTLESFVNTIVDTAYDFDVPLPEQEVVINYENFFLPSFEEQEGDFFDEKVTFFTQAADNNYFFKRLSMSLHFKDELTLDDLSDGEYQILFLYALIDLFDSEDTLFLLDEVDSHLHYKNIENLWDALHSIQGSAITTTHLLDSITSPKNGFDNLKIVQNGVIKEHGKVKAVIDRLSNLSRIKSVQFDICSKLKNIVLMDDYNDWTIFLALAKRKGLDISLLSSIYVIKQESSCGGANEELGKKKFEWIESLLSSESNRCTENIFLICDRDEALVDFHHNGVSVVGQKSKDAIKKAKGNQKRLELHFLAWKRREIKTYLLSFTALNESGVIGEVNNGKLPADYHLRVDDPGDNESIRALDVKSYITDLIDTAGVGLDETKLNAYVGKIPESEISEDIENMYNYLRGSLS
ncbi:ABC transporter ATP-binding protein [Vibrio crassostreae]|uniref:AAA family ATPase n=1 Tax=Vibrio crassostreae TaxID=246167 RepID=UPI00148B8373|nr:AAA family ATPase [Vibrio crassostreae]NOH75572.1 ATP-binding protein [Vibrio crassostreae]CAK2393222.1 ABC transporter ATP-binding protein [Vibrio crassostreae]CAK2937009.1 ABC transporter ATP-binding protein [Vibrio crassostreae]CAK3540875.1 ABC transporter ATP-binding protein [Vibrio crassostreae]